MSQMSEVNVFVSEQLNAICAEKSAYCFLFESRRVANERLKSAELAIQKQLQKEVDMWDKSIRKAIREVIAWIKQQGITLKSMLKTRCNEMPKKEAAALRQVVTTRIMELDNSHQDGMAELMNVVADARFNLSDPSGYELANRLAEYTHMLGILNMSKSNLDDAKLTTIMCYLIMD
jgi:hypothetical protein